MGLGIAASGSGGHFLWLINSGDLNKYKLNREAQNPDCLDTSEFDKLILKIKTSDRKHQTFQDNSNVQF
jgi:hypothetical protein